MEGFVVIVMGIVYFCDWEIEMGKCILFFLLDVNIMLFEQVSGYIIYIIVFGSGFLEDFIYQVLLIVIYVVCEYLIMIMLYFVFSDDLLYVICIVVQCGVDVSIILFCKNDLLFVGWVSCVFFSELLVVGVKIYQFEGGLLYIKSVLVDGELSLVGIVNFDMCSLWFNFEIMLVIDDMGFGVDLVVVQDDYILCFCLLDVCLWVKCLLWQCIIE